MKFSSPAIISLVTFLLSVDAYSAEKRNAEAKQLQKFHFKTPPSQLAIAKRAPTAKTTRKPSKLNLKIDPLVIGKREASAKNIKIPGHPKRSLTSIARRDAELLDDENEYDILARDIEDEWEILQLQLREAYPLKFTMGTVKRPRDSIPSYSGGEFEELLQLREAREQTFKPRIGILAKKPRGLLDDQDV